MDLIINFDEISISDLPEVGGKNASLGEMTTKLSHLGIKVPPGFAITADAYRFYMQENHLDDKVYALLDKLNVDDIQQLTKVSQEVMQLIENAAIPLTLEKAIHDAYQKLQLSPGQSVAVRSSATAEDLPDASFAGQQETYLNVQGIEHVLTAVKKVFASLFTSRAISYREHHGFQHQEVAISVGIQQMIRSDLASSGVMFTLDTESGFDQVVFITSIFGLGEAIVQGAVNPDEFYVHKPTLAKGKAPIIKRKAGDKKIKMIYSDKKEQPVETVDVAQAQRHQFSLSDQDILELAKKAMIIEKHYGNAMDIEWAKDGLDGELYIVQARPETVESRKSRQCLEQYSLLEKATARVTGRSIGQKIGQGKASVITDPKQMHNFVAGSILVADMTDPDWEPIMKKAAAIVTNRGGRTCHAAIIARELGIPAVIGTGDATKQIKNGDNVTVSCAEGDEGYVYPGLLKFEVDRIEIDNLPPLPVKICMNLANPEKAFAAQFIPNEGIGLARLEFIMGSMIGVHPNAVLHFDEMPKSLQQQILEKSAGYDSPKEFFIEKLAEGVATIAAAFYPKPIIVRFSDFKSNEYANFIGGEQYEPDEENPMIGYRGASRYISGNFQACFALECEAMKRVREQKGLTNTHVMFPFVRTLEEAKTLVELTESAGLVRGKDGLNFYMMCEIPSNVLMAEEFLQYFDGFSIGSNDLTQLTLGLDRDSALVAHLFDERNPAVKALLHQAISVCKKHNKYVGICGQGPSDHLDFAQWLMQEGIVAMSLTPDSIIKTWVALSKCTN